MSSAAVAMPLQKLSTTTVSYFLLLAVRVIHRLAAHTLPIPLHEVMSFLLTSSYVAYTYVSNYLPKLYPV
ncbi:hypothetical protein ADUPG1_008587 [Aduncisulcus paluster]|uniref:Uncharacterized protein n=1 Tax=Aduncisulcus paluster TaxID=2918883 RepID=A0ABQ5KSH8_9EUKA|nr:hypothetical protein ADUPG1_008587 [Aduncisulcus paluster]